MGRLVEYAAGAVAGIGDTFLLWLAAAMFAVIVGLVGYIGRSHFTEQRKLEELISALSADVARLTTNVALARGALAEHARWSRREHKRIDERFRDLGE